MYSTLASRCSPACRRQRAHEPRTLRRDRLCGTRGRSPASLRIRAPGPAAGSSRPPLAGGLATVAGFGVELEGYGASAESRLEDVATLAFLIGTFLLLVAFGGLSTQRSGYAKRRPAC